MHLGVQLKSYNKHSALQLVQVSSTMTLVKLLTSLSFSAFEDAFLKLKQLEAECSSPVPTECPNININVQVGGHCASWVCSVAPFCPDSAVQQGLFTRFLRIGMSNMWE